MHVAVVSSARWSLFRLSKQYTALALASEGHDVIYVDPPISPLSLIRDRARLADMQGPRVAHPAPHLRVWRPIVAPGQNSAMGQRVNAWLLRRGLARHAPRLDLTVAFSLEARGLLPTLPGRKVYYCTDSAEDLPDVDPGAVRSWEQELVDAADLVVACSLPLCEQLEQRGASPLYLPHATDEWALRAPGPTPSELSELPRPLVGYVGSLNFRIDVELLEAARRALDGGTLVLIGAAFGPKPDAALEKLLDAPDVVALGNRPSDELISYLAALDVGLVPYSNVPFNRKSFPIKVLQYLAAGLPVVSSPNGATDEFADVVLTGEDPESFEHGVRRAAQEDDGAARTTRRTRAAGRTWADNVRRLVEAVG